MPAATRIAPTAHSHTKPVVVDAMLQQLTEDELEMAARSSFAYTRTTTSRRCSDHHRPTSIMNERNFYAAAMAQRYLESKKGNVDKALSKMRATLEFRRDKNNTMMMDHADTTTTSLLQKNNTRLYKMLNTTQKLYVASRRDRQGRATYVFVPRRVVDHDFQLTRQAHLWTLEKTIACTRSTDGTINAVVDFGGFDCIRQAPPLANGRELLTLLRDHYVGRVHRIYFVRTPVSIHWLWNNMFARFAGTATKQKIVFVSKNKQQECAYDADPSWWMQWDDDTSFPMETFLSLPFDQLLGDTEC